MSQQGCPEIQFASRFGTFSGRETRNAIISRSERNAKYSEFDNRFMGDPTGSPLKLGTRNARICSVPKTSASASRFRPTSERETRNAQRTTQNAQRTKHNAKHTTPNTQHSTPNTMDGCVILNGYIPTCSWHAQCQALSILVDMQFWTKRTF